MPKPELTPLEVIIRAEIIAHGPMRMDHFMARALYDAALGYYRTARPLGAQGDFITAPEISQVFGELLGLWVAQTWVELGRPDRFRLIELGPGRGVLMADALRAIRAAMPICLEAMDLTLIEINPHLRAAQSQAVGPYLTPLFADDLADLKSLKAKPHIVLGNEFLDCLPVRQFQFIGSLWQERAVGVAADGTLVTTHIAISPDDPFGPELATAAGHQGMIREVCPGLGPFVSGLAELLNTSRGRALFVDYGYVRPEGVGTLQALYQHTKVPVFDHIGQADLTALVDFGRLARLAQEAGLAVSPIVTQADLLQRLGVEARAQALIARNPDKAEMLAAGFHRLMAPEAMGTLFKAVCLSSLDLPPPVGFPVP